MKCSWFVGWLWPLAGALSSLAAAPLGDPFRMDPPADAEFPAQMAELIIDSHGSKIMGLIYIASGKGPHPTLVLAHGFPGNERNLDLAQVVRRAGWNAVYFNYRGSWGSQGSYSYQNSLRDISSVLRFLKSREIREKHRIDASRLVLFGHSFGGGLVLLAVLKHPEVKAVISLAGFNVGAFAAFLEQSGDNSFAGYADKQVSLKLESGTALLRELVAHKQQWNPLNHVEKLSQKKILLISDTKDERNMGPIYHTPLVAALEKRGAKDLTHVTFESDHAFSGKRIAMTATVLDWLKENVP